MKFDFKVEFDPVLDKNGEKKVKVMFDDTSNAFNGLPDNYHNNSVYATIDLDVCHRVLTVNDGEHEIMELMNNQVITIEEYKEYKPILDKSFEVLQKFLLRADELIEKNKSWLTHESAYSGFKYETPKEENKEKYTQRLQGCLNCCFFKDDYENAKVIDINTKTNKVTLEVKCHMMYNCPKVTHEFPR
jgi:hypothetical protein